MGPLVQQPQEYSASFATTSTEEPAPTDRGTKSLSVLLHICMSSHLIPHHLDISVLRLSYISMGRLCVLGRLLEDHKCKNVIHFRPWFAPVRMFWAPSWGRNMVT
uniref:Uncharacterized protein n=1 Tax=Eutreptiella gymnastica TaxID=73025 RepID=A0A7S1NE35_9EUGL|mmetsp:Transcript_24181/g.43633  ORF Transcript_24181/g.43633 Transcript_24181/m.43633 type:complete len:105 (+) Transcript_24181:86-400(+)